MATSYTRRAIIIVPNADAAGANTYFKNNIDTIGGDQTFTAALSTDGMSPGTHCWCDGRFILSEWNTIDGGFRSTYPNAAIYRGNNVHDTEPDITRKTPDEALTAAGLQLINDDLIAGRGGVTLGGVAIVEAP